MTIKDPEKYYGYKYDFSHADLPSHLKQYEGIMRHLEEGKHVNVSPYIPFGDILDIDKYYDKMSRGDIKMIIDYKGKEKICRLIGLPPAMTAERDFDNAVNEWWWKFPLIVIGSLIFLFVFFLGLGL